MSGWVTNLAFDLRCTLPLWLSQLELGVFGWIGIFQPPMWNPRGLFVGELGVGPPVHSDQFWKGAIFFEVPLMIVILILGWSVELDHFYLSWRVLSFQVCERLMVLTKPFWWCTGELSPPRQSRLKLLDITELAQLRADGHPNAYMNFQPFAKEYTKRVINDCLHWCLPGPIDVWNDILVESLHDTIYG